MEKPPAIKDLVELYRQDHMDKSYRLNWQHYADRQVDSLKVIELQQEHDKIAKTRGPAAARQAIRALRILCNYAIKKEVATRNPALGVDIAKAVKRDVFLEPDEIAIMLRCLDGMSRDARDFFRLALSTGMRKSNILGMRKAWVSLVDGTVTVPPEHSKNKREMVIHLSEEAASIIRGRMPGDNLYVFPGRCSGHAQDAAAWLKDLRRRMREMGVTRHFVVHDMRRTFATELTRRGCPLPIVSGALGHSSLDTTAIYARTSANTIKEWLV